MVNYIAYKIQKEEEIMGKIVIIMGKSSSGKDTIYARLLEELSEYLNTITLYTTRPIRPGEVHGKTYFYTDDDGLKVLRDEGKVIEERPYETIHGVWRYATVDNGDIDLENNSYITIGTLVSLEKIRNYYGEDKVIPIYLEIDDDTRARRALNREFETQKQYSEMCRRWLADEKDFSEENINKANVIRINNTQGIDSTMLKLIKIILVQI